MFPAKKWMCRILKWEFGVSWIQTCNMTPSGNRTRINENLYMLAARSSSRSRIALVFRIWAFSMASVLSKCKQKRKRFSATLLLRISDNTYRNNCSLLISSGLIRKKSNGKSLFRACDGNNTWIFLSKSMVIFSAFFKPSNSSGKFELSSFE